MRPHFALTFRWSRRPNPVRAMRTARAVRAPPHHPSSTNGCLRTMCGSRTGGWSLPCVISDWQRCVDWFFAKYCRCRLRLDWCWCRWRTSEKGRRRWGLQVWRRQVGFVRGTRWPAGSSAGRMVAWTARWSHGRFLGWASNPRSSRDYVGVESWVEIGGGYTEFAGFPVVYQKTTRFLGWSTKLRPKNRRRCRSTARPVWPVGLTGLTVEEHRFNRCATTQSGSSNRRTRVGIARLASRLSMLRSLGIRPMEKAWRLPKPPLRGLYL
jgi:hypothetical protein